MKKTTKHLLAIYIRVSDPKQVKKGISLQDQENRAIDYANKLGWQYEIFKDAGLTGGLVKDRPKLAELVERIAADEINGLFNIELDRLTREITDGNLLMDLLIKKKIRFFDYTGERDLQDEGTETMLRMNLIFNNLVKRGISRKVKRNMETRVIEGKVPSRIVPYGYDKDKNGYLVIHPEESKVVKLMYDLANTDNSVYTIAKFINKLGHKTKVGKEWTGSYVHRLITKTMNKGVLLYGDDGKKPGHTYDKKEYPCPAIVTPLLFDSVQAKLKSRNSFKDTTNDEHFLLKGLLFCKVCGRGYYVHKPRTADKLQNMYKCKSGQTEKGCGNKGIYVYSLDKIITDNVNRLVEIVEEAFGDSSLEYRTHTMRKQMKEAKAKLDTLKKEKNNLVQAIVKGWVKDTDIDIDNRMNNYNTEIEATEILFNDSLKELGIVEHKDDILDVCKKGVAKFKKMKDEKDKIDFLRSVISKIVILYTKEEKVFDIFINFKINQLEKYLIIKNVNFKTPYMRNDSFNNPKILTEKITLEYHINIDEETEQVMIQQPYISFDNYYDKTFPDTTLPEPAPSKRRKSK